MSRQPCSIVIPTWNARELVDRCLRSLEKAMDTEKDEVVVVDDGSTDGTCDHIQSSFPYVKIERFDLNRGFGPACNAGISRSQCDIVILLNNDIIVDPGFLEPLLGHFSDPLVFAVNARVFQSDGVSPGGGLVRGYFHCGLLRLRWSEHEEERQQIACPLYANGAATALDRSKFLALGGFDILYHPFYSEDLDLSYRAYRRGWLVYYEPQSVVLHDHSVTITEFFDARYIARISKRNRVLFVWRNIKSLKVLGSHIIWLFFRMLGAMITFNLVFLLALKDAIMKLPDIYSRRRQDPPNTISDSKILKITAEWSQEEV